MTKTKANSFKSALLQRSGERRRRFAAETDATRTAPAGRNDLLPPIRIDHQPPGDIIAPARRIRKTDRAHVQKLVQSIKAFGFSLPILIRGNELVDGRIRLEAAAQLQLQTVPCIDLSHLSHDQARILSIAINRLPREALGIFLSCGSSCPSFNRLACSLN